MGDELALTNDPDWASDPAHADDNRWAHRPPMRWGVAAQRHDATTVPGRMFATLQRLARARASTQALRSDAEVWIADVDDPHVLAFGRYHPRCGPLLVLANFSDTSTAVDLAVLTRAGITAPHVVDASGGRAPELGPGFRLPAWGHVWVQG